MLDMLESQVLTRIKYGVPQKFKDKYPILAFTNSDRNDHDAKGQTEYVHAMQSSQTVYDTYVDEINEG